MKGEQQSLPDEDDESFAFFSDSEALVTAQGQYIADLRLPGMADVAFLRSPIARGRIVSVDLEQASRCPGVVRVASGAEIAASVGKTLPGASLVLHPSEHVHDRFTLPDYPLLPVDGVCYEGEAVAVVVAEDRYLAEDAVEQILIDYEDQAPVLDPEKALEPGTDQIHADVPGNLALEGTYGSTDDPREIFDGAALVLRRRYRMNRSGNPPLEALGVVAQYENRRLTVWSTIQRPQILRIALADIFGLPASRVRVIAPHNIGGGFGWKSPMYRETAVVAWLAMQLGRPVRWIEDRTEALKKGVHERDQIFDLAAAFDANGRILALESEVVADVGSLLIDMYGLVPSRISATTPTPYVIPWQRTHLRCAITNKAPVGVNRPAGRMPATWAVERLMDDASRELGISSLDIRTVNLVRSFPHVSKLGGGALTDSDYLGSVDEFVRVFRYGERLDDVRKMRESGRCVGIGLAVCVDHCRPLCSPGGVLFFNQPQYSSVTMRMYPDGSVAVMCGDAPQGQMRHTTMAKVTSAELGVDVRSIDVYTGDTLLSPVVNSNTDVASVCAVAARRLRAKLLHVAAQLLKVSAEAENFHFRKSTATYLPDGRQLTFRELAWAAIMRPYTLGTPEVVDLAETAYVEAPYAPTSFAVHGAVVEFDRELGKIRVLSYGFVGDCGKPLNPRGLRTAITAGIATGISNTTHEAYIYDDRGQLITSNLKDYAMLAAGEMPNEIVIGHHNTPTGATVYGHKRMITEGVPAGVAPAVANAIIDALGGKATIDTIPIFPDELWKLGLTAAEAGR